MLMLIWVPLSNSILKVLNGFETSPQEPVRHYYYFIASIDNFRDGDAVVLKYQELRYVFLLKYRSIEGLKCNSNKGVNYQFTPYNTAIVNLLDCRHWQFLSPIEPCTKRCTQQEKRSLALSWRVPSRVSQGGFSQAP